MGLHRVRRVRRRTQVDRRGDRRPQNRRRHSRRGHHAHRGRGGPRPSQRRTRDQGPPANRRIGRDQRETPAGTHRTAPCRTGPARKRTPIPQPGRKRHRHDLHGRSGGAADLRQLRAAVDAGPRSRRVAGAARQRHRRTRGSRGDSGALQRPAPRRARTALRVPSGGQGRSADPDRDRRQSGLQRVGRPDRRPGHSSRHDRTPPHRGGSAGERAAAPPDPRRGPGHHRQARPGQGCLRVHQPGNPPDHRLHAGRIHGDGPGGEPRPGPSGGPGRIHPGLGGPTGRRGERPAHRRVSLAAQGRPLHLAQQRSHRCPRHRGPAGRGHCLHPRRHRPQAHRGGPAGKRATVPHDPRRSSGHHHQARPGQGRLRVHQPGNPPDHRLHAGRIPGDEPGGEPRAGPSGGPGKIQPEPGDPTGRRGKRPARRRVSLAAQGRPLRLAQRRPRRCPRRRGPAGRNHCLHPRCHRPQARRGGPAGE